MDDDSLEEISRQKFRKRRVPYNGRTEAWRSKSGQTSHTKGNMMQYDGENNNHGEKQDTPIKCRSYKRNQEVPFQKEKSPHKGLVLYEVNSSTLVISEEDENDVIEESEGVWSEGKDTPSRSDSLVRGRNENNSCNTHTMLISQTATGRDRKGRNSLLTMWTHVTKIFQSPKVSSNDSETKIVTKTSPTSSEEYTHIYLNSLENSFENLVQQNSMHPDNEDSFEFEAVFFANVSDSQEQEDSIPLPKDCSMKKLQNGASHLPENNSGICPLKTSICATSPTAKPETEPGKKNWLKDVGESIRSRMVLFERSASGHLRKEELYTCEHCGIVSVSAEQHKNCSEKQEEEDWEELDDEECKRSAVDSRTGQTRPIGSGAILRLLRNRNNHSNQTSPDEELIKGYQENESSEQRNDNGLSPRSGSSSGRSSPDDHRSCYERNSVTRHEKELWNGESNEHDTTLATQHYDSEGSYDRGEDTDSVCSQSSNASTLSRKQTFVVRGKSPIWNLQRRSSVFSIDTKCSELSDIEERSFGDTESDASPRCYNGDIRDTKPRKPVSTSGGKILKNYDGTNYKDHYGSSQTISKGRRHSSYMPAKRHGELNQTAGSGNSIAKEKCTIKESYAVPKTAQNRRYNRHSLGGMGGSHNGHQDSFGGSVKKQHMKMRPQHSVTSQNKDDVFHETPRNSKGELRPPGVPWII